jgi:hypothetical protein
LTTQVYVDKGVLPNHAKVYQCTKCHTVFVLEGAEDCREIASWNYCCTTPYVVPLVVKELEYGDEVVTEVTHAGRSL